MITVAINGFGRIGRMFFRTAFGRPELDIVAVNDLGELPNLAYLLQYDSVYRTWEKRVEVKGDSLVVDGKTVRVTQEKDPTKLPWGKLGVDVVVESTGIFETFEKASVHLRAGAQRVVISAPAKDEDTDGMAKTVLLGINDDDLSKCTISSNGSCTTNSAHPVVQILHEAIGIKKAMLTTIHSYTATQRLVDGPDKGDWRRGRAAAQNIMPSSTGAAISVTRVIKDLKGRFDGIAVRVPSLTGSLSDITFVAKRKTSIEEVNATLQAAEKTARWKNIFRASTDELVSSDIIGEPYASIADLKFTRVVDGDLVKVLAWYDNEMGYTHTLIEHVIKAGIFAKHV